MSGTTLPFENPFVGICMVNAVSLIASPNAARVAVRTRFRGRQSFRFHEYLRCLLGQFRFGFGGGGILVQTKLGLWPMGLKEHALLCQAR